MNNKQRLIETLLEKAGYKLEVLVSKEDLVLAGMNEKK